MRVRDWFDKMHCSGAYSVARRSILAQIAVRGTCAMFRRASLLEVGCHTPLFPHVQETEVTCYSVVGLDHLSHLTIVGLVGDSSVPQHLDSNVPIPCLGDALRSVP